MDHCNRIQDGLWRYVDRELSAAALAEISAHLKVCSDCSRIYEARARETKHYRMAFLDTPFGESFVDRFRQRFEAEGLGGPSIPASVPGGASSSRLSAWRRFADRAASPPRRLLVRWAPAAAILLMGALVVLGLFPERSVGRLDLVDGGPGAGVEAVRGGRTLASLPRDLRAGDTIVVRQVGQRVRASLSDGSEVVLTGPAEFRVESGMEAQGPFHGHLSEGTLHASVPRRGVGRDLRMRITSDHASALVLGTRFTLEVRRGIGTVLAVDQGEVDFFAVRGGRVVVRPGKRYEARDGYGEPLPVQGPSDASIARPHEDDPSIPVPDPRDTDPRAPSEPAPTAPNPTAPNSTAPKRPNRPLDGSPLPDLDLPK